MHRDKTVARIILVLSIVHGALAAPVVVRRRYPNEAALSEKRNLDDESPHPGPVVSMSASDSEVAPDKLDGSYFTTRVSRALQLHDDPPAAVVTLQMRYDPPETSGTPPSQNDPPPASGDPQLNNDPPAGSGATQVHDDPTPPSQNDPPPASGDPQLNNDPPAGSGATQVHDDPPLTSGPLSSQGDSSSESELGLNHVDSLNHVHSTSSGSDVDQHSVGTEELEGSWEWHPGNPEANMFFTESRLRKIMIGEGVVAALAIPWGVSYGVHKLINSHKHKRASSDLASSDIVGRGQAWISP